MQKWRDQGLDVGSDDEVLTSEQQEEEEPGDTPDDNDDRLSDFNEKNYPVESDAICNNAEEVMFDAGTRLSNERNTGFFRYVDSQFAQKNGLTSLGKKETALRRPSRKAFEPTPTRTWYGDPMAVRKKIVSCWLP